MSIHVLKITLVFLLIFGSLAMKQEEAEDISKIRQVSDKRDSYLTLLSGQSYPFSGRPDFFKRF
jgi:hypothetical protein